MPTLFERSSPIGVINNYSSVKKGSCRPPH